MQKNISLRLSPSLAANDLSVKIEAARSLGVKPGDITGCIIQKRSVDARGQSVKIQLTLTAFINEPIQKRASVPFHFQNVQHSRQSALIIGAGPAGLFAALKLIEAGIRPVILERGKDVKARRRDLAILNKEGIINPESNYCFGEGGAGTYSDGKLYTRSNKRGDINRILHLFVHFGAPENILYDAHPHIGTNKLPQIITAMRQQIIDCGGDVLFNHKVTDIISNNGRVTKLFTSNGAEFTADAFILATGHSARDIFMLLNNKKILIEAKPFALGVRVEHPQPLIDSIQYHCSNRGEFLPPASYSLVKQVDGLGVFSFCMCPGGIIAPASTAPGELVVNGWSPSKRNNPFANSGMVVSVSAADAIKALGKQKVHADDPLLFLRFQQLVEQQAYLAGGGQFKAPAQRMVDFSNGIVSGSLPSNSYLPGLEPYGLHEVLPGFVYNALSVAFREFGKKMRGYFTNEANVVATESRTSSPVRIPRDIEKLSHPQLYNFFPCGEGAGYAGGIVSAAMDGENVASAITQQLLRL